MAKTTRRVRVALGEALHPVGEIVFEFDGRRQACMFRYAPEWLDNPGSFGISPTTMPLAGTPFYSAASRERHRASARIELGDTDRPVALVDRFDRVAGDRVHYGQ